MAGIPRIIADKARVVDYLYSRDGNSVKETPVGVTCPYSDRTCDCLHCLSINAYPEDSTQFDGNPEDRSEFGYCIRIVKEILEIETMLLNKELKNNI